MEVIQVQNPRPSSGDSAAIQFFSRKVLRKDRKIEPSNSTETSLTEAEGNRKLSVVRRNGKIEPQNVHNETSKKMHVRNRHVSDVFNIILSFGLMIGIPVSTTVSSVKKNVFKSPAVKTLLKTWQLLAIIVSVACTVIQIAYNHLVQYTTASRMTVLAHCFSGEALIWVFLFNRRRLNGILERLQQLSSGFDVHVPRAESRVKTYFLAAVMQTATCAILSSKIYFYEVWDTYSETIKIHSPISPDSVVYDYFPTLVIVSMTYFFCMATMILYFTLVLCGEAYRGSARLIAQYEAKLRNDIENRTFDAASAIESISHFKRVSSCTSELVNVFGPCIFFIFYDLMNQFFGAISFLLSGDLRYHSTAFQILGAIYFVMGVVMLLYLINSCDTVRVQSQLLKKEMVYLSYELMSQSPNTSTLVLFNLLCNDIKSTNFDITCWGLFEIDRRSLLSIIGSLISYNALIFQLGATKSS